METLTNKLQREVGDISLGGGSIPDKRTEVEIAAEEYARSIWNHSKNHTNTALLTSQQSMSITDYIAGWKACEEKIQNNTPKVISWSNYSNKYAMFATYLQQYYEPCETLGMWQLKGGVQSYIVDIYNWWKEKFNIQDGEE